MIQTTVGRRRSDLATRAMAGAAMIAVALAALWLGGVAFWLLVSAAGLLMVAEWCGLTKPAAPRPILPIVALGIALFYASPSMAMPLILQGQILGVMAAVVALLRRSLRTGGGLLYAGLPALGLIFLRDQPHGVALTLWTLAIVWATDIGAYFAGRAIGGPKLAPRLSPNKTWAGLGGGVLASLLVSLAVAIPAGLPLRLALLAPLLAVLAQMGDLFESWLKRRAGVKDSGRLLPGHGGAMDRLDGVVPVAVVVAALVLGGWA